MLVELAIADAYGAAFEYATEMIAKHNDGKTYSKHPRHETPAGCYTDDAQMSIAVAEAMVAASEGKIEWTARQVADFFVEAYHRDPRSGYSRTTRQLLESSRTGQQLLDNVEGQSAKSGAAMRAPPIGVAPTIDQVLSWAKIQAQTTHRTEDAATAAQAAALMTHYCLYGRGPLADLDSFLKRHAGEGLIIPWEGKVRSPGLHSVSAAATALMRNRSLTKLLIDCVAFTGDTDTVCSIAVAAASCCQEYKQDLEESLFLRLEQGGGDFGLSYLQELDKKLLALKE